MSTLHHLVRSAALVALLTGTAIAQDATIHYNTPILRSGQPVIGGARVETAPVVSPVSPALEAGAPVPATPVTAADTTYLGTPQMQTSAQDSSVSFVTGGIGAYEKAWFDHAAGSYNLKASYNDTTGHNLAGVNVALTDASGNVVLNTVTEGPYLLVKAKPGTYTLTSTYEGQSKSQKVTLGGRGTAHAGVVFSDTEAAQTM